MEAKPYKIPHPFRKLSKELVDIIVQDLKEGSTQKLASESNGITNRIFDIWRKQGEIDLEHKNDSLCAYLVLSLAKIRQQEVKWCRSVIKKHKKGHKGAEWTLEHAYWRSFGNKAEVIELAEEIQNFQSQHGMGRDDENEMDSKSDQTSKCIA